MNWRKSSYSGGGGNECIELNGCGGVRDSKNPDGPRLEFDKGMAKFLLAVKRGQIG